MNPLPRWGISHVAGFLSRGAFCMRQIYRLPAGAFRMRQVYRLPAGAFRMRHIPFRGEHFRMRQLRGGEAFIVAKAILPSSRSTPPGHAAVLRCGMCCFAGGAMDFTVLDIVGYADINALRYNPRFIFIDLSKKQGTGPLRGPLSRPPSSIGSA